MSKFDLQIQLPNHTKDSDFERHHGLEIFEIQSKFEQMGWRRLRVMQLQLNGENSVFKAVNLDTKEFLSITLNAYSASDDFEFRIESNIQLISAQRELFGLLKRTNKEIFAMKQASLEETAESLMAFFNHDEQSFKELLKV